MATTIAKLNVLLSASAAGYMSTLGKAASATTSFAGKVATIAVGNSLSRLFDAGAAAVVDFTKKGFDTIDTIAKLSDRLGIATESIAGLQYAADLAGVSSEELTIGLQKMLVTIGEAGNGSKSAVEALDRIGLSTADLAGQRPDQIFGMISDKLSAISDPAERAAAAVKIFGKAGQSLLPLLFEGSDGLAALQAEAEKLGLTFNRIDAAQVEEANDSFSKLFKVMDGIGQKLAVELSPFISAATQALTQMATEGSGVGEKVVDALEWIVSGIASMADWLELGRAAWNFFKAGVLTVAAGVVKAIDLIGEGIVAVLNLLPGVELEWTDTFHTMADSMAQDIIAASDEAGAALERFDKGENSAKVAKAFDDIRANAKAAAEAAAASKPANETSQVPTGLEGIAEAEDEIKALEKKLAKLSTLDQMASDLVGAGALPEQIKKIKELNDAIEQATSAKERMKKLDEDAKRVAEDNLLPVEKYKKELADLSDLLVMGKIDMDTYQRAAARARDAMSQPADMGELSAPDLLEAGGSAVAELLASNEARATGDRQKVQEKQLTAQESMRDSLVAIQQAQSRLAQPVLVTLR